MAFLKFTGVRMWNVRCVAGSLCDINLWLEVSTNICRLREGNEMKTNLILPAVLVLLLLPLSSSAQSSQSPVPCVHEMENSPAQPEKITTLTTVIKNNGSTSPNSRAPQGSERYIRTCYIISASELANANVPLGAMFMKWGFTYDQSQNNPTTGVLKIYLQNTTDKTWSKSLTWTNGSNGTIDAMTLVHNGSVTIPAAAGSWDIPLSSGGAFKYDGGALYVAFEYQNPTGNLSDDNVALCSNELVGGENGLRNSYSTTALPETLKSNSSFRPETRAAFSLGKQNDAMVQMLYSYGKVPLGIGVPVTLSALIQNYGVNSLSNVNVTLRIIGANSFTNSKIIPSLPNDQGPAVVTFDGFSPTAAGTQTVTVAVASDDNNDNNSCSSMLTTTNGVFAYCDTSQPQQPIGYTSNPGILLVKYHVKGNAALTAVATHLMNIPQNSGKVLYGVALNSVGKILDTSANYTTTTDDLSRWITLNFPKTPTVTNQDFYIGIGLRSDDFYPVAVQTENPVRPNAYFCANKDGTSITELRTQGRLMIEATVSGATVVHVPGGETRESTDPTQYKLAQNFPNPFNPSTVISYDLPVSSDVTLKVYDMLGQEIVTLVRGMQSAGTHRVTFNKQNIALPSGVYYYAISTPTYRDVKRMILMK
jgi:hypothetical protein